MSRGGQIVASLVLAIFGIVLAVGAMEVGVRVLHLVPTKFWQPDPLLGTALIPGKKGWWTQEEHEFRVPVQINSLGLRDLEREYPKPDGSKRVLLIGDSHVEALQVPLEDAVGPRLEETLRAKDLDVEVISAGVSGYGTAGELLFYRERGWKFSPDLVLLAFYPGNDVKNNGPELEKALVPEYGSDGGLIKIRGVAARSGRGSLLGRLQSYVYLRKLILTRQPALARRLVDWGLMKKAAVREQAAPQGVPLDYWVYAEPRPAPWVDAWQRTMRNLDDFASAVRARGSRFAVVVVTSRDHLYPESWEALREAYPRLQQGTWNLDGPTQSVLEWCESRQVSCLHLLPEFQRERDRASARLHYVHDGHWTSAGHRLAAQLMAAFVTEHSLL